MSEQDKTEKEIDLVDCEIDNNEKLLQEEIEKIKEVASSDLSAEEKEEEIQDILVQVKRQRFSGPLPPPALLDQYNQIVPGSAEEIIRMSTIQREHTMKIESALADSEVSRVARSLDLAEASNKRGTYLLSGVIVAALISVWSGAHPTVSIAFLSIPIIMGLKNLLFNHENNKEKNSEK